jgi:hypothetical protein
MRRTVEVSRLPNYMSSKTESSSNSGPGRSCVLSVSSSRLGRLRIRQALVKVNGVIVGILCNYGQKGGVQNVI